jgi:hypothetical protein
MKTIARFTETHTVREGGLEPPRPFEHWHLKPARLPIPPLARTRVGTHSCQLSESSMTRRRMPFRAGSRIAAATSFLSMKYSATSTLTSGFAPVPTNMHIVTRETIGRPVGILDNFEKGLERAVNGAFAKTFRSGLQPVELTSALRREIDTKAAVVTRDRILAPNKFTLRMAPSDYARMRSIGPTLTDELTDFVQQHAANQHYQFAGGISISLAEDGSLSTGILRIDSENVKGSISWAPVLDIAGKRYPLVKSRTVIGRGSEADITVNDTGISRKHVEVLWDGSRAQVRDLGSTNGSQLNGQPVKKAIMEPGSTISIGRTAIVFKVLPQASPLDPRPGPHVDDVTRRHDIGGFWSES